MALFYNKQNALKLWQLSLILILSSLVQNTQEAPYNSSLLHHSYTSDELDNTHVESKIIENEYIVSFRKYLPLSEHKSLLSRILGTNEGWSIISRNNPSVSFPSDFSLIKVSPKTSNEYLSILRKASDVKYVFPQKRYSIDSLKSTEEKAEIIEPYRYFGNQTKRFVNRFSIEDDQKPFMRKLHSSYQVPELFNAQVLWNKEFTGTGVKVAVFDTGLRANHPHFKNVVEIKNWTDEDTTEDGLGHGTFVTGVIASQKECLGFVPDASLHIFRVFTNKRASYTSWFLDAFNYAILARINILNLSIGGPDFMDLPFVEKVWELSANNIIVVSAIGNDGPLYGTLNNPADMMDAIGVGAITFSEELAEFSSRGMTTWELPEGYGRVKPDILAYGKSVQGSRPYGGCKPLSGTSVASPVVAGAVALLASTVPESKRWDIVNPASMKQVLTDAAEKLPGSNIFEQGYGKLNLLDSYELLSNYVPRASALPSSLDLTNCPYMWPYCTQSMYYGGMPVALNITILNGMGVSGELENPPTWKPAKNGDLVELSFSFPEVLWPWSGYLGIMLKVHEDAKDFEGDVEGVILFNVVSPPGPGESQNRKSRVEIPMKVHVIPTPPRQKRILWDQYHNVRYPPGYIPRDALDRKDEPFDWNADHIHTNFRTLYTTLRSLGYFVEVLGSPFTCFDARDYGTLMIVDSEDEFFPDEMEKLTEDVRERGLSIFVVADWYNVEIMKKIKFFDDNTRQWWTPATGGSNVPALNDLLNDFGIAFGDKVYDGEFDQENRKDRSSIFSSGSAISRFPPGGSLGFMELTDQGPEILEEGRSSKSRVATIGVYPTDPELSKKHPNSGRIAIFGDSSCLDDANQRSYCFLLLEHLLNFTSKANLNNVKLGLEDPLKEPYKEGELPKRLEGNDMYKFSKVIERRAQCPSNNYKKYQRNDKEIIEIVWEKHIPDGPKNSHGQWREGIMLREVSNGYQQSFATAFLPYGFGLAVIAFVIGLAWKTRKNRPFARKPQV